MATSYLDKLLGGGLATELATSDPNRTVKLSGSAPPTGIGQALISTGTDAAGWGPITGTATGLEYASGVVTAASGAAQIGKIVRVDPTANAITIVLPATPALNDRVGVLLVAAGSVTVTVPEVGSLRDPQREGIWPALTLTQQNHFVELVFDGAVWRPVSHVVRPVVRAGNIYIDPPDAPHALDDEFDGGSPDLAARGWIVRSIGSSPTTLTREGDVDPLMWPSTITLNKYRSTIYGSTLMFQCAAGVTIHKLLPASTTAMRLTARLWPSALDTDANWSGMRNGMFIAAQLYYALPYAGSSVIGTTLHCDGSYRYRCILNGTSSVYNNETSNIDRHIRGDLLCVESNLTASQHSHAVIDSVRGRVMKQTPTFSNGVPGATQIAAGGCEVTYAGEAPSTSFATRHWTSIDYIRFRPYGTFFPR